MTLVEVNRLKSYMISQVKRAVKNGLKMPVRDWLVVDLALSTGLRVKEVSELKCGDLFIDHGRSYLVVRNGKGNKSRIVRFNEQFKNHIEEFIKWKISCKQDVSPEAPLIISSSTHSHISTRALQKIYKKNCQKVGITGHSFHHMRHTYASMLYKASNYNLRLVQKQLGHSTIAVTEIYADVLMPDMDKAIEKLYK